MKKIWLLCLVAAAVSTPAGEKGEKKNPFADDPQAAKDGRPSFRAFCSFCHGIQGQGGRAPDLTLGTYSVGDSDAALFDVISHGVPGTEMPDFGERLGEDDIWRLVSYLRTLARRETGASPATPKPASRSSGARDNADSATWWRAGAEEWGRSWTGWAENAAWRTCGSPS